ncbi:hypothetical protein ACFQE2_04600 [Methylophaga thalassica]|uniref:hypothetical protein n=1 Tax=Methylophaga thalassica TaxID=40223 RepID=UPI00360C4C92
MSTKSVAESVTTSGKQTVDLAQQTVRDLNQALHDQNKELTIAEWEVLNPKGEHNLAVGLDQKLKVDIYGPVGYYCAGMNKEADITVHGHAGQGIAENMMSGSVRVKGNASSAAGATAHGVFW